MTHQDASERTLWPSYLGSSFLLTCLHFLSAPPPSRFPILHHSLPQAGFGLWPGQCHLLTLSLSWLKTFNFQSILRLCSSGQIKVTQPDTAFITKNKLLTYTQAWKDCPVLKTHLALNCVIPRALLIQKLPNLSYWHSIMKRLCRGHLIQNDKLTEFYLHLAKEPKSFPFSSHICTNTVTYANTYTCK